MNVTLIMVGVPKRVLMPMEHSPVLVLMDMIHLMMELHAMVRYYTACNMLLILFACRHR